MKENAAKTIVTDADQDEELLRLVREALEQDGSLFPSTPESVERAESEIEDEVVELPPLLATFGDALELASKKRLINCAPLKMSVQPNENLSRAAREGGEIPPEVELQMRRDRAAAEELADGKERR